MHSLDHITTMSLPRLSADEERTADHETLVRANVRLALQAAHRLRGCVPVEEALQVALIALWAAAKRYKPEEGYRFVTVAYPRLRSALRHARDAWGRQHTVSLDALK